MSDIKIVTVVNDYDCYEQTIKNSSFMNKYDITAFDNKKENVSITKRYNSYIKDNIFTGKIKDSWIVFCHQDFAFVEDPIKVLSKHDKEYIYAPIGAAVKLKFSPKFKRGNFLFKKDKKFLGKINQGFNSDKYILPTNFLEKKKTFSINKLATFNLIDGKLFMEFGKEIAKPKVISSPDCCCMIVHSDLLLKHKLLFDENLDWHCYAEEFCLNAKYKHRIKTMASQFNCYHLSLGNNQSDEFKKSLKYLKSKYKGKMFGGICFE